MASRTTVSGSSTPPLTPTAFFDEYAARMDTLFDASALPLTSIGGTGDAVTATLDPPLAVAGTFVDGMKFTLSWAATNTAGVTLAINGGAALAVVDSAGAALVAGSLVSGLRSLIEYIGGSFRILSPIVDGSNDTSFYWSFTANGTWNKPTGLDADRMVLIQLWAGGGGGATLSGGAGGGGGGYREIRMRYADLPSSVSVTIGAGGAAGAAGSNTTFGALATAYGGGAGVSTGSGGGGGALGVGGNGSTGIGGTAGRLGGGAGVGTNITGGDGVGFGGGAGGGGASGRGGDAHYGGGGGGGGASPSPIGLGGRSIIGGDGGDGNSAGTAPGGGGGRNGAGARGEVRVWI